MALRAPASPSQSWITNQRVLIIPNSSQTMSDKVVKSAEWDRKQKPKRPPLKKPRKEAMKELDEVSESVSVSHSQYRRCSAIDYNEIRAQLRELGIKH